MRGIRVAAERRANAVEFVSGDGGPYATTAHQYSNLGAILHRLADLFRVIRIIVRYGAVVRAEVDQIVASVAQLFNNPFVERISTMICSDCNTHSFRVRLVAHRTERGSAGSNSTTRPLIPLTR